MIRAVYFHTIEGRMRIHISRVKGSQAKAGEIKDRLESFAGINCVNPNPITGNVLITYDSHLVSQWDILGKLQKGGYLGRQDVVSLNPGSKADGIPEWGIALARVGLEALFSALVL